MKRILFILLLVGTFAFAGDPPPDTGGDPTVDGTAIGSGDRVPHNAPVGDGIVIFMALGMVYVISKFWKK